MKNIFKMNKEKNEEIKSESTSEVVETKKKKGGILRASIVLLLSMVLICGIIYPLSVTMVANAAFPYEANGSQITVTLEDGTKKVYGSELIGQNYEEPKYLFGRVNLGAPSNLAPDSDEYKALLAQRLEERKAKLKAIGYEEKDNVPDELLTASGSGLDPHISKATAYFQVDAIVYARKQLGEDITAQTVIDTIDKYTEGKFLGLFGQEHVNVLLVNLSLDGLI